LNSASQTVRVDLSDRSYDILIGRQLLAAVATHLRAHQRLSHVLLITDENVRPHAETVNQSLADSGIATQLLTIVPGEKSKSVEVANQLWQDALAAGAHRQSVIVAVGGGVVGDLAGFIAATFARGIDFVQVPTTLLAQVDSSVGGKVGINLPGAKNMVGAFWQPRFVLIDTDVLTSLPDREFRSGLAEVVKYGVILDEELFSFLENNAAAINDREPSALAHTVARCCRLKAAVVTADERETSGHRAALNYGHTFGHAIEAVTGYGELLHGEAISIGMLCASRLAEQLSMIDAAATERQHRLLTVFGLPTEMPAMDHDKILAAMQHDKKVENGKLGFILPARIGQVTLVRDIDTRLVRDALKG
jgi:3-dehydroquinate synthase